MISAKKYETVFKFVRVMPRKLVASFFLDTVYNAVTLTNDASQVASSGFGVWGRGGGTNETNRK